MAEGGSEEKVGGGAPPVFISYASQDAEVASRFCEALRAAGIEVWFDQSELRGGDAWDASIRKQVKECAVFLPLISANTDARSEGYFRREWNLAVSRMLDIAEDQPFLVPVVIDGTPEATARVPDRFRERHWTRLPRGEAPTAFADRVMRLLSGGRAVSSATPGEARSPAHGIRARADEGFWVAVLPFRYSGSNADLAALAEGLTEDIVTGLSQFSYLRVIARSSTSLFSNEPVDVRTAAKELGLGYVEGVTHDYIRHGTTTLFAALDVANGAVFTQCKARHRHQEFLGFLRHIELNVPKHLDVHLVVDNYGTHKHAKVKAWLARRPRFHVHYTPTYSSWLNQVERWFGLITQRAIRRGSFDSMPDLKRKINEFVEHYNQHPQPFMWTATAESILAKLERLGKVTCGTQH
jgi:hypothetical protein